MFQIRETRTKISSLFFPIRRNPHGVAVPAGPSTGSDPGGDPLAHKKKKKEESIEIPITPMLDMAFQLLTFFILTYHPTSVTERSSCGTDVFLQ